MNEILREFLGVAIFVFVVLMAILVVRPMDLAIPEYILLFFLALLFSFLGLLFYEHTL